MKKRTDFLEVPNFIQNATNVLILADAHVGAMRAIWPPGGKRSLDPKGYEILEYDRLTPGQQYLWDCWDHMWNVLPKQIDVLIFAGDHIQGYRTPWATSLTASVLTDQERAFNKMIIDKAKGRVGKIFMLPGTRYHGYDFGKPELNSVEAFETARISAEYHAWLNLNIRGKIINAVHGHPTAYVYRTTPLEKEAFFNVLANAAHQTPKANVIIRAHIHFYAMIGFIEVYAFFAPCWFLPDEQIAYRLASFYKMHPVIGGVLLQITDEQMPWGVKILPITYDLPKFDSEVVVI